MNSACRSYAVAGQFALDQDRMRGAEEVLHLLRRAEDAGLDYGLVRNGLFGNGDDVSLLALVCWGLLPEPGSRGTQKGSALLNHLIGGMLQNCANLNIPPPITLCVLYDTHHRIPWSIVYEGSRNEHGLLRVRDYCREHPGAPIAQISKATKVDRRTIRRWRDSGVLRPREWTSN